MARPTATPLMTGRRMHARRSPFGATAKGRNLVCVQCVRDFLQRRSLPTHGLDAPLKVGVIGDGGAADRAATTSNRRQALRCPGCDHLPLPLGDGGNHMGDKLPAWCRGVDGQVQNDKPAVGQSAGRGGLENRWPSQGGSWVRIPPPPLKRASCRQNS